MVLIVVVVVVAEVVVVVVVVVVVCRCVLLWSWWLLWLWLWLWLWLLWWWLLLFWTWAEKGNVYVHPGMHRQSLRLIGGRSPGTQASGDPATPEPSTTHSCESSGAPKKSTQLLKQHLNSEQRGAKCKGLVDVMSNFHG